MDERLPDLDSADPRLVRAALQGACQPHLRGLLQAALAGVVRACGAAGGAAYLVRAGREGPADEILVTEALGGGADAGVPGDQGAPSAICTAPSIAAMQRALELAGEKGCLLPGLGEGFGEATDGAPATIAAVPVKCRAGASCLLILTAAPGGKDPGQDELRKLRELSCLLAPLLSNHLRIRDLEEMTIRDDTADCYNRRHLEEYLSQETARARRFRIAMSVIFFDLDDLKSVNNAHGHRMGSLVLKQVAQRVSSAIRRIDRLFRFGGDEFCIVLPETGLKGALEVAERVRESTAGRPFLEAEVPPGVHLTASFGVASYPEHASTGEEILALADAAMRRIKAAGKNSISVAA